MREHNLPHGNWAITDSREEKRRESAKRIRFDTGSNQLVVDELV